MPHKQKEVGDLVRKHGINVVGILDTRVQERNLSSVTNNCFAGWQIERNYNYSEHGKIWVCWKQSIGTMCCKKDAVL